MSDEVVYCTSMDECRAIQERLIAQRDELRAVLAPLLDNPWRLEPEDCSFWICTFCRADAAADERDDPRTHNDSCPVPRKDELLGRHGASRQATRRATS